ncbi:hypothetical protein QQ045_001855 [Rhodiola kirilowii]
METPTLDNLDVPIMDEYHTEEMERLDMVAVQNPDYENAIPRYIWDHPDFEDISAWDTNPPADEYMGGNFGQPDPHESLGVGTEFDSKELAKHAVRKWSIMKRVEYEVYKSNPSFMVFHCRKGRDVCLWSLRIAALRGSHRWEVRNHREQHICQNDTIMANNVHMTPKYIAKELWDVMTEKLRLSVAEIQARIYKDYGLEISPLKAWQAKQQTMINLFGTWDGSFADLPKLMKALVDNSPETVVKWDTEEIDGEYIQVNRVFWAFAECIHAFRHCRPVLSIDGTHMYGKYRAKLLVACSLDANNNVLPVAFALVESENTSSWSWFMSCIREGVTNRTGLCVISDRHGGIMATMSEPQWSPPNAYHRICVHHFQSNFNTRVKNAYLKKKLGKVAYAKKEYKFANQYQELMQALKDRPDIREWLRNIDVHLWSLAMDTDGMRWGSMTTNASESFNNVLKHGRDLPISALVMFTFKQLNKYFNNRRYRYDNTDSAFAPKVHERLEVLRQRAQFHRVVHFNPSQGIYQVTTGIKHHMWKVCLPRRECECGKWTTLHIPCSHAIAVCKFTGREYSDYVPHEYTLAAYNMTWSYHFSALPHSDFWEPYNGLPHMPNPHFKRTNVGRNPTRRRRTEMDQRDVGQSSTQGEASSSQPPDRIQRCKLCHQTGHNRRSCPSANAS